MSLSTLSTVTTAFANSQPLGMPIMEIAGGDERLLGDSWRLEITKSTPACRSQHLARPNKVASPSLSNDNLLISAQVRVRAAPRAAQPPREGRDRN